MSTTISAGGIAPLADGVPAHTDRLIALSFAINDRPLVRLIPEKLNHAETLTLKSLGVSPGASKPVGAAASRAVGFPAWPIINDPDNAHHALNLVGDLEWARRNAQNNAKRVKERFDALVVTLTSSAPHFVPTLLEELARIFYSVGNVKYAKQYFGKARKVERVHALPIDNDRHRSVFVEFAVAGVVGAQELTAEASAALERSDDPEEAFDYVLSVNAERMSAGVAPYAFLVRDMRKLGKAAGLSADEADDKLFDSILGLKSFHTAPAGFFTSIVASLGRYASTRPDARTILLSGCPGEMTIEKYLTLLENAGTLAELRENKAALAAWIIDLCENVSYSSFDASPRLIAEILTAGTALRDQEISPKWYRTPLDVLDALAECGVTWTFDDSSSQNIRFSWSKWFAATRRPLNFLADDPVLAPELARDLHAHKVRDHLDLILANDGAKKILLQKIDTLIEEHKQRKGSTPEHNRFLEHHAENYAQPALYAAAPERLEALFAFDAAEEFCEAMRMGILTELTWPLFEQEYARLSADPASYDQKPTVFESYPAVSLVAGKNLEVIDGDRIVLHAEMPAQYRDVHAVRLVGDQAMVTYVKPNCYYPSVFWTGSLAVTDCDTWFIHYNGEYSLPINNTRLTGQGLLVEDGAAIPGEGAVLSADSHNGPTFIQQNNESGIYKWNGSDAEEWHGSTSDMLQELGAYSDSGLDFSALPDGSHLDVSNSTFVPVQPTTQASLLGSVNGVHVSLRFFPGHRQRRGYRSFTVSSLGTFASADHACPCAVVRRPGGGVWLTNGILMWDAKSDRILFRDKQIHLSTLPLAGWHQLRPTDENASAAMRAYTCAQAEAVLNSENINRDLISEQLGTTEQRLIESVASLAACIRDIEQQFAGLRARYLQQPSSAEQVHLTSAAASLLRVNASSWHNLESDMVATLRVLSDLRDDTISNGSGYNFAFSLALARYANNERRLIGLIGSPLLPTLFEHDDTLSSITSFIRALVDAKILGYGARLVSLDLGLYFLPLADSTRNILPVGTVVDGCLIVGDNWDYDGSQYRIKRIAWVPDDRLDVAGYPVLPQHYDPLSADKLHACLDAIEHSIEPSTPKRSLSPDTRDAIASSTALSDDAVTYLFGGLLGFDYWKSNFLTKEQRAVYGFTVKQSQGARWQLKCSDVSILSVLAAAVPADNPVSYITDGADAQGVADYWNAHHRVPDIRLSSEEFWSLRDCLNRISNNAMYATEEVSLNDESIAIHAGDILRLITVLAASLPLDDSRRPLLASKLEWLRTESARIFAIPQYKKYLCDVEFGAPFDDSRFAKAKTSPRQQSIRVLLEGHLDSLIADLKTKYTTTGSQWDPEVSVPELVQQVMQLHALSTNAARYFLQLLALAHPTDANIRAWNGWKKKDIDTASAELLDKGLIVEAKRSGAGRSRFLPGGWLPGSTNNKPMEVWKAPHYLLWQADMVQPAIEGCPVLMPAQRLFEEVWERYTSGDVPGYEELKTTRYRSRRR